MLPGTTTDCGEEHRQAERRVLLFLACASLLFLIAVSRGFLALSDDGLVIRVPERAYFPIRYTTIVWVAATLALIWFSPLDRGRYLEKGGQNLPALLLSAGGVLFVYRAVDEWWISLGLSTGVIFMGWIFRRSLSRAIDRVLTTCPAVASPAGVVLGVFAFALYFLINHWFHNGEPYVPDSHARLFHALILNRGLWYLPAPDEPQYYVPLWVVVRDGHWYSQFLPGSIVLNLLGLKIGSVAIVFALLAGGCVWMTMAVGKQIYDAKTALFGTLLLMLSPMYTLLASSFMEHVPAAFFLMAAFAAGLRNLERPTRANAFCLGFFLGYACITRPLTAAGFAGPLLVIGAFLQIREWKRRWPCWAIAALGWSIPVAFLLFFNTKTNGNPFLLSYRLADPAMHSLGFTALNHHTPVAGLLKQVGNLHALSFWLFMWPVTSYFFVLVLFLSARNSRKDALLLLPTAGLAACYFFYPYQDSWFSPRFLAESLPPLCLVTARGILETKALIVRNLTPQAQPAGARALAAFVVLLFLAALPMDWVRLRQFHDDSHAGQDLGRGFARFHNDPLATVFFPAGSHYARSLVDNALCQGGAQFLIDPTPKEREAYMARHPERHYYYVTSSSFWTPLRISSGSPPANSSPAVRNPR